MSSPSEHGWALEHFSQGIQEKRCSLVWAQVVRAWQLPPPFSWNFLGKPVGLQIQGLHRWSLKPAPDMEGKVGLKREADPPDGWMVGLISKGTSTGGLSWAAARWVGLLHYLPNLKRLHRALSWFIHILSPPGPNTNWLSQGCVLETSLSLGQQWAERIFQGQKRGWGAFDFPGPAGGSICARVLLITSSQQKPGSPEITMQLGSPRHPHGCSSRTERHINSPPAWSYSGHPSPAPDVYVKKPSNDCSLDQHPTAAIWWP